jgi:hypothetical protein
LQERIEILVVLAAGGDEESRLSAFHTLQSWPPKELQEVLRNPSTPVAVLGFVAENLAPGCKELGDALLRNPSLPGELREWLENIEVLFAEAESSESFEEPVSLPPAGQDADSSPEEEQQKQATVLQRTQRMTVVEKVRAALTGSQEERMILIRDSNKVVARAVMQSPKLSDHEVEKFAAMKDVGEEVLRLIAANRRFRKTYVVIRALVNNPRTPIDLGLRLLKHTNDKDLKWVALNRNVSQVIRRTAEKIIQQKEEAAKPKLPGKH